MCGISCVIDLSADQEKNRDTLNAILKALSHRGHANHSFETHHETNIHFGCNRLPFTSENQPQPVFSASGRFVVLLNGEIYNFHHLKAQGISDTKAAANHIEAHGLESINDFDGMFALIVWDKLRDELILARDRIGIKPLYFAASSSKLFVSSELKGLCIFEELDEIQEVKPGTIAEFSIGKPTPSVNEYYVHDIEPTQGNLSFEDYSNKVFESISKSVFNQSQDREKYGVFLSGGLDSTAIFALLREHGRTTVPIVIGRKGSPDRDEVASICERYGTTPHEIPCPTEQQLFRTVHEVIKTVESFEPNVVRQSCVSMLLAAGASSLGLDVVFCGEGADELFGGYPEMVSQTDFQDMRTRFLIDLHRTQLQRVDRSSMSFTTEVRVPFLSNAVISCALDPRATQYHVSVEGDAYGYKTKRALRHSMRQLLHKQTYTREKVVLSEGAGVKGNDPLNGMFSEIFSNMSSKNLEEVQAIYPDWRIATKEEAFYFSIFSKYGYHKLRSAKNRVTANQSHTT